MFGSIAAVLLIVFASVKASISTVAP